jgi:hypothetical protein
MTQLSVPACVYLYFKHYERATKLDEAETWQLVMMLLASWLLIFTFLLGYVIVPEYRKTFWSTQTGWQKSLAFFLDNEGNDERRIFIMDTNMMNWRSIEKEVKVWTRENWRRWESEKPAWFNDVRIAAIPDEFMLHEAVIALGGAQRRRNGSARKSLTVKEALALRRTLSVGVIRTVKRGEMVGEDDGSEDTASSANRLDLR